MMNGNIPQQTRARKKKREMGGGTPLRNIPELRTPKDGCTSRIYELHCLPLLLVALETGDQNPGMLELIRTGNQSLRKLISNSWATLSTIDTLTCESSHATVDELPLENQWSCLREITLIFLRWLLVYLRELVMMLCCRNFGKTNETLTKWVSKKPNFKYGLK